MAARYETTLAMERRLAPELNPPELSDGGDQDSRLEISVVFTSVDETRAALRRAGELAASLSARVTLVVPQIVPYPLPLSSPPVLLDWSEPRYRRLAAECPLDTIVRVFLCRDRSEMLIRELKERSLVVIGGGRRRWKFSAQMLARHLRRAGHHVVFAAME